MTSTTPLSTLLVALLVACVGILVVAVIITVTARALLPHRVTLRGVLGARERKIFAERQRALDDAKKMIESGLLHRALPLLKNSLFLTPIRFDDRLIDKIATHHVLVLEQIIAASSQSERSLLNLPVIEDLLMARTGIERALGEARASRNNIQAKEREKGRATPAWASAEIKKRVAELEDRLRTNAQSIESQLEELFAALQSSPTSRDEVIYH